MPETIRTDICVIGAGSGGLSVAAGAAAFGVPVVLIERARMGGDCLNVGCVPSKALIAAARRAHDIRTAGPFGLVAPAPQVHFARVQAHVRRVIETIAPTDSAERFQAMGVRVIRGEGRFVDRRTVAVGDQMVRARRFVLAVGSRPALPPIEGLADTPFLTNETVFELAQRPERLIVLGGGPIGLELGQAFRRLGSEVIVLQKGRILPREDDEAALAIRRALVDDGVELREEAETVRVDGEVGSVRVRLASGETISGTHLLIAAGRPPASMAWASIWRASRTTSAASWSTPGSGPRTARSLRSATAPRAAPAASSSPMRPIIMPGSRSGACSSASPRRST